MAFPASEVKGRGSQPPRAVQELDNSGLQRANEPRHCLTSEHGPVIGKGRVLVTALSTGGLSRARGEILRGFVEGNRPHARRRAGLLIEMTRKLAGMLDDTQKTKEVADYGRPPQAGTVGCGGGILSSRQRQFS